MRISDWSSDVCSSDLVWHLQDFAGEIDRALQPGLADLGAVRAAKRFRRQPVGRPAGGFRAGTGRKERTRRTRGRQISHLRLSSQRARAALGQRGPRALLETERRLSSLTRTIHPGELRAMRWVLLVLFVRSEEHTSELQSLLRISYAVFCLKKQ